jgi:DNA-binding NarL/FixJ family response regulator
MSETRLKVLIADDHPLIVAGLRRALADHEDIEIVGEAHSGSEVMPLVERRRPDVVLLDLNMPGDPVLESIERIAADRPATKTVVLSACEGRSSIDAALNAGASAYVVKSVKAIDIASVVRQAATGAVFHAGAAPRVSSSAETGEDETPLLTEREQTILDAIAAGLTTAAISEQLWVSEHTVKFHLTNIYRKLGVANRAGAIRYALKQGLAA